MDIRLKKQKDFDLVFKKGKRLYSESLTLIYLPAKNQKVGFAVSKKHGKSVRRNRIKRLLREAYRSYGYNSNNNFFFVFIPKIKEEYSFNVFKKEIENLLSKL